nr:12353_t:CDS:2 [Entrophospora candida]
MPINPIIEVKLTVATSRPNFSFFLLNLLEGEFISQKVQIKSRTEFQTHHQTVKNSHSEFELAQKLLGKILVRNVNGQLIKVKIVETEAYDGRIDRACHAHQENRSREPQGVLIRAAEPLDHHTIPVPSQHDQGKKIHYYTNGPGKLCRALNIDISLNHVDLTASDLIYLESQPELNPDQIIATTRVNIDYAGEDKNRL